MDDVFGAAVSASSGRTCDGDWLREAVGPPEASPLSLPYIRRGQC
jgi:hypothetical protein